MAEISVPAWPMPTQKTKLTMSQAQADRVVVAPDAGAFPDQVADVAAEHGEDRAGQRDAEREGVAASS